VPLVAAHRRTDLTLRQVAQSFGVSKSAADRVLDHLAPLLAISPACRP
jgi:DNA-binding IclR family transcriptional regulator